MVTLCYNIYRQEGKTSKKDKKGVLNMKKIEKAYEKVIKKALKESVWIDYDLTDSIREVLPEYDNEFDWFEVYQSALENVLKELSKVYKVTINSDIIYSSSEKKLKEAVSEYYPEYSETEIEKVLSKVLSEIETIEN